MKRPNQKGVALIFAMIFVLVLSVTAASLMFLSQSETWSSMNYRLMTQSRYGAEAGLHAAANYLMNTYPQPGVSASDPITAYNVNVSPVTLIGGGNPIALGSTMNNISANYPVSSTRTGFNTATQNSLAAGSNNVAYTVSAELVSMRPFKQCLSNQSLTTNQPLTAQLWKLTSHGDIAGVRNSEVEVSALLESHVTPCYNYAGFATGSGCGSISFNGGGTIDSYDSGNLAVSGGSPVTQAYEGNLGSNGNVNTAANTVINGTFSSPDQGVGPCSSGSVDALSGNTTSVTGCSTSPTNCVPAPGLIKLSQAVTLPTPQIPTTVPAPSTNLANADVPLTLTPCSGTCPQNGNNHGNYGDIGLSGGASNVVTFVPAGTNASNCAPGIYYVNSISLTGNASIAIGPCPGTGVVGAVPFVPAVYQPVIIYVVGNSQPTPLDLGGNGIANNTFNSTLLQIQYAGNGAINLHGNGQSTAVLYAPNAGITFSGNANWYGSVIGKTIQSNGNASVSIHYDRALQNNLVTVGNWTMDTFTWSKF
jgi:Tfp pilus assembly protein PilX